MRIFTHALTVIYRHVAEEHPREACGLLLGTERMIELALPCRNTAKHPMTCFELDPAALLRAHREARTGGRLLLGWYHSHPSGRAEPSLADAAQAVEDGRLWLIVADGRVSAWLSRSGGVLHNRFDRVALAPEEAAIRT